MNPLAVLPYVESQTWLNGCTELNNQQLVGFIQAVTNNNMVIGTNFDEVRRRLDNMQASLAQVSAINTHFQEFVKQMQPELFEQYIKTIAVQTKLELANEQ